jgi:hypothetical protein
MNEGEARQVARRGRRALPAAVAGVAAATLAVSLTTPAGTAIGPDVTVHELEAIGNSYPLVGGFRGYSVATRSCNQGDQVLNWCDEDILPPPTGGCGFGTTDSDHPVIAQNIYRLADGRFEQIGMSWLKHGFTALQQSAPGCGAGDCQPAINGDFLGVGCTDPYSAGLNGSTPLGKRSEVDATTGEFPFPYTPVAPGDGTEQRIRVAVADLDPALNPGARYWVEGHYVAPDDAAAGNGFNNASHREISVNPANFNLSFVGGTVREKPAIAAWKQVDPLVEVAAVDVPGPIVERYHVARRITDQGGGVFHYEYAVHNLNSDRAARALTIEFPAPTAITGAGFHDIDHHSGEPYATTDWGPTVGPASVSWSSDPFATDPNANALRWGTLFNFWFDADRGPSGLQHTLELFKPGSPASIVFEIDEIFTDGFESGDTSAWTADVP